MGNQPVRNDTRLLERLQEAVTHMLIDGAKKALIEAHPPITRISWELHYEVDDQGDTYKVVRGVTIEQSDGRKITDVPDLNDLLNGEFDWWLSHVELGDDAQSDFDEAEDDEGRFAVIGRHWFGIDDGAERLPKLFPALGYLLSLAANTSGDDEIVLTPSAMTDPAKMRAIAAINGAMDRLELADASVESP